MPFGIGAGAVLRIDDADVHVLHAEVAEDGGFSLGEEGRSKEKQKQSKDKVLFHNKVILRKLSHTCIPSHHQTAADTRPCKVPT
ncbi:MAG: hypothetical protein F082_23 [bacterium F082]|nr:MAG: hypothetical protein F082_23 [bacterium F082]